MWILALALMAALGGGAARGEHHVVPEELSVLSAHRLLSEARCGKSPAWTPQAWIAVEEALACYREARRQRLAPIDAELVEAFPAQYWMNWPALKDARALALRDAALTESLALERALFGSIRTALAAASEGADVAAWLEAVDRAERRRRRSIIVPIPSLARARIVDVEGLVQTIVSERPVDPELRAIVDEWSRDLDGRLEPLWRRARQTEERYRAALLEAGIDPIADADERARWLPRAFDLWLETSDALRQETAAAIVAARPVIERIAAHLDPDAAQRLLDEWIAQACAMQVDRVEGPVTPEIAPIVEAWRSVDRASRWESVRRIESSSASQWPLAYGGWDHRPVELARRPGLAALAALDAERTEAAARLTRDLGATETLQVVRRGQQYLPIAWSRTEPPEVKRSPPPTLCGSGALGARSEDSLTLRALSSEELDALGAMLFTDPTDGVIWSAMVQEHLVAVAALDARLGDRRGAPTGFLRRPRMESAEVTGRFEREARRADAQSALETRLFEDAALLLRGWRADLVLIIERSRRIDHALHVCRRFHELSHGPAVDATGCANSIDAALEPLLRASSEREAAGHPEASEVAAAMKAFRDAAEALGPIVTERARIARKRMLEHFLQHTHPDAPHPDHLGHTKPVARWWEEERVLREQTAALQESLIATVEGLLPEAGVAEGWRRVAWPEAHGVEATVRRGIAASDDAGDLLAWFDARWSRPTEALVELSRGAPPLGIFEVTASAEELRRWRERYRALEEERRIAAESAEVRWMILRGASPASTQPAPRRVW